MWDTVLGLNVKKKRKNYTITYIYIYKLFEVFNKIKLWKKIFCKIEKHE